ncbi:ATP-binding domain-containing protein [Robiginitalea aurantiaca]|uniref:DNA 3'-5' helicase II n=1 Tax=Robiginitalea aurantiaca TaxID=3056915 RepID=A0ABT7WBF5_9FLAO|nr:ATP-binding domain-containing protein [Robiginitalea aurantiaca]MDM9630232.1 3'-5' exonuclease [Robiginitalea aurantiaca]
MSKEAWFINESELDDFQIPIIQKKINNSFVVKGCAGSGKTVLALWKAREIEDTEIGSYYFIVYTKALRQFINDGVDEVGLEHSRVVHYYKWKHNLSKAGADYIIIDEVQDFSKDELLEMQRAANKAFILFGDSAQQIYSGLKDNLMTMEQVAFHTQLPMENLVRNHRLKKKIARVAQYLNTDGDNIESRCTQEGQNKPLLIKTDSQDDQLEKIMEIIDSEGYTDVGILFPDNKHVKYADKFFSNKQFRVESKYDISWPDNTKFNLNFHSDNPKLMTYHSAKGLQFEAVFIPYCSSDNITLKQKKPLYVAMTRTYQDLIVLFSGLLPPFLQEIPDNLFQKNEEPMGYSQTPEEEDDLPF